MSREDGRKNRPGLFMENPAAQSGNVDFILSWWETTDEFCVAGNMTHILVSSLRLSCEVNVGATDDAPDPLL